MTKNDLKTLPKKAKKQAGSLQKHVTKTGSKVVADAGKRVSRVELTPSFIKSRQRRQRLMTAGVLTSLGVSIAALAIASVILARSEKRYQVAHRNRNWTASNNGEQTSGNSAETTSPAATI